jgi:hypothetical protein
MRAKPPCAREAKDELSQSPVSLNLEGRYCTKVDAGGVYSV